MDQHPVPQNITSYEFRLVGDMTLKQFFQLAGGGIVGVVIYQLPLPFFVKWPLIFMAVGTGAALAFIPVQGRSFSQWLTAFFGAIYAPTEYYWSPTTTLPSPSYVGGGVQQDGGGMVGGETRQGVGVLDQFETQFFGKVTQLFGQNQVTSNRQQKEQYETQTPMVAPTAAPTATPAQTTSLIPDPQSANILTGLIKDSAGLSLEGAIVEIVDTKTGMPARALRTNKLGQFQIATPLSNGSYTIIVDKQGFVFNPVLVNAEGEIIKPILIKST